MLPIIHVKYPCLQHSVARRESFIEGKWNLQLLGGKFESVMNKSSQWQIDCDLLSCMKRGVSVYVTSVPPLDKLYFVNTVRRIKGLFQIIDHRNHWNVIPTVPHIRHSISMHITLIRALLLRRAYLFRLLCAIPICFLKNTTEFLLGNIRNLVI